MNYYFCDACHYCFESNIKQEAAKDYDVAAKNGTVNGVNLMIEGKGNVTVSGGIVKFNS